MLEIICINPNMIDIVNASSFAMEKKPSPTIIAPSLNPQPPYDIGNMETSKIVGMSNSEYKNFRLAPTEKLIK